MSSRANEPEPLQRTIYVGPLVDCTVPNELHVWENAIFLVNEHGKIELVQLWPRDINEVASECGWSSYRVVNAKANQFFFPGFVDTHIHASQYGNSGIFGDSTLMDWLERYTYPAEASLDNMKEARAIYERCVRRTLSHGTTTAAYYATISVKSTNLLADICLELGQRALIGRVAMDTGSPDSYRDPSAEEALQRTKASIAYIESIDPSGDLIQPIITPRFALGCSRQSMQLLGQLHRNANVPVQTHISETEGECQAVEEKYPGHTYASVYDEMGLLGEQTILAHAIHLSRQERALLSQRGARISHCPLSNDALGSGAARVRWLLDGGLIVGLGTDVSGGYSPSVLQAARQACLVSRRVAETEGDDAKLSVPEVLHLATKGGAKVLGLKNKIGELSEGMCWDAQLIELAHVPENSKDLSMPVDIFGHEDWNEKIAKWVFNGDDRNTVAVWVNGRLVHGSIKE